MPALKETPASVDAAQPIHADEAAEPPVQATYVFDRNRIHDSRLVGASLLALTDAGHLVRFDTTTFAFLGERLARRRITCLGPVESGGLIAGLEDGTIVRVSVETLLAERVGEVPGWPVWIGQRQTNSGLVVAYGHLPERFYGYSRKPQDTRIRDLASGRIWKPKRNPDTGGDPTTFLIDRRDRLWVGTDHGEWGGRLEVIDLQTGLARDVSSPEGWSGIFGLIELSNGQVWAYGGTAHMMCTGAFIARVDGRSARFLYDVPFCEGQGRGRRPGRSADPVTNIVELDRGRILIFAYNQVSASDVTLKKWRTFARLDLRYEPGRPDAVSSYPAVRAIHVADARLPRLVLATARDGYVELEGSGLRQHALAAPKVDDTCLPRMEVRSFSPVSEAAGRPGQLPVHALPAELARQVGVTKEEPLWGEGGFFVQPDGRVVVVASGESDGRGTRITPPLPLVVARWDGTSYVALGGHSGDLRANDAFVTPDGALWALNRQGLWRFDAGHFTLGIPRAGKHEERRRRQALPSPDDPLPPDIARVLGDVEPPWVALESQHPGYRVHRSTPGGATGAPRFEAIPIVRDQRDLLVRDAIAWRPGEILISTTEGLLVLQVKTGLLKHLDPVGLDGDVGRLARDRHGRTWVGGTGLWLLENEARARAIHGSLPFFGAQEVWSLSPCQNADVLLTMADGGAALIALGSKSSTSADPQDELSLATVPSREQTVMAYVPWIRDSDLSKQQQRERAFWQLVHEAAELVEAGGSGRFGGVEHADCYVLFFHGPDAEILAAKIAPMFAASDAVSSLSLIKRFGPPGAPRVMQVIKAERAGSLSK